MKVAAILLAALAWSGAAGAEDLGDFCADRPGLGTPACTIDRGHLAVELGLADWTIDRRAGSRTDSIVAGDLLLRYGLSGSLEAQIGWQALGIARDRDAAGAVDWRSGSGDLRLALRQALYDQGGSGFAVAVMPFVTLPVGGATIGEGDWTAGVVLPISYALPNDVQIGFTAQIDAAADAEGSGHHLAYGGVLGLDLPLGKALGATLELAAERDEEGAGTTEWRTGLSLAWSVAESVQLDTGAVIGLDRQAPDLEFYLGVAKRF